MQTRQKVRGHQIRTVDGLFPIPFSNVSQTAKRDAIVKSNRDTTDRLAHGKGPSRATKFDLKESQRKMDEQQQQQMQTSSTSQSKSPKEPSPLLDLVRGSRRRARQNAEREEERRKSRGGQSNATKI